MATTYCLKRKNFGGPVGWAMGKKLDPSKLTYAGQSNLSVTPGSKPKLSAAPIHPQNISSNGNMNVFNAGKRVGQGSVGVTGGLKNTWRNAGTMGKAGMVGAGVGAGYLLGKGLGLWGNKN